MYSSHVKLFYGASRRGVWSIGSDAILKERPDEGPKTEVITSKFLEDYPEIPAPNILRDWVDSDGQYFVLTERMKGETLEKAWPSLSDSQKITIADQVVEVRSRLRSITSPAIQRVDGSAGYPGLLFWNMEPHGPFHSDSELWDALVLSLQKAPEKALPQKALQGLKKRMPKCEPYVLTHCDLNLGNIIVKEGALVGILDWEYAAYLPVWCEYVSASWGWTEEDFEWKKLFQERMNHHGDGHEEATAFWKSMRLLRKYPNLNEKEQEAFDGLCSEDQ